MRRQRPVLGPGRLRRGVPARPGFTLLELVVVMGLVGALVAVALPRFDRTRMNVDAQTQALRSVLVMAQRTAVTRGCDVVVAFDTAGRWVRVQEDPDGDLVLDAGEVWNATQLDGDVVFGRGSAPVLKSGRTAPISFSARQSGRPALVFHRDGSASEQGTVYLSASRSSAAAHATDARALEVVRATGRVEAYRYTRAWERTY